MTVLRLALGFLLVVLGLVYLFYPTVILRMNAFMRENVFQDSFVLFHHKRVAAILLIIGFLYMVFTLKVLP